MTPEANEASGEMARLMAAIIGTSPYHRALRPLQAEITRIALANHQLSAALAEVLRGRGAAAGTKLRRADLGSHGKTFAAFLEHVHFASPAFLKSVGEWPLEGRRD